MTPLHHPKSNKVFTSPDPEIGDLPAIVDESAITTFWQPDAVERASITAGAPIQLTVFSPRLPPFALTSPVPEHVVNATDPEAMWRANAEKLQGVLPVLQPFAEIAYYRGIIDALRIRRSLKDKVILSIQCIKLAAKATRNIQNS